MRGWPRPPKGRDGTLPAAILIASLLAACTVGPTTPTKIAPSPGKAGGAGLISKGGANVVPQGGGNLVPNGGANLVPNGGANLVPNGGANLVPNGGANLVPNGGANLVPNGGANLVPNGGANLVPNGGANLVPNGGANLVPNGGGNLVPNGGGNLVPNGGGMFTGPHAAFASQLHDLAAIAHTRAVAQIVSNNGAKIVSNHTSGLLAPGASLIGNNGGQAISNNGASYALAQLAAPAFAVSPAATETAGAEVGLPDGTFALPFDRADGTQRIVVVNAARRPLEEQIRSAFQEHPNGALRSSHTERTLVYGDDQRRRGFLAYDEQYDDQGRMLALTHAPSEIVEPTSGLKIAVKTLAFTVEPPTGSFEVRFEHLGAVETGTITQVVRNLGGLGVGIDLADPLATLGGESRFATAAGDLLFERRAAIVGAEHQLLLTLRGGYVLDVARASRTAPYRGKLLLDGKAIGTATLTTGADAAIRYEVAFDDQTPPLAITIPDAAPAAPAP